MNGQKFAGLRRVGGCFFFIAALSWVTWSPSMRAAARLQGSAQETGTRMLTGTVPTAKPSSHHLSITEIDTITDKQALACIAFMLSPILLMICAPLLAIASGNVQIRRPAFRLFEPPVKTPEPRRSRKQRRAVA